MPRVSALAGKTVLLPKKSKRAKDGSVTEKYQKFGRIRTAVFAPDGRRVVGFVIKRPDVAGMIKRGDAFLALDSFGPYDEKFVVVTRPKDGLDDAALTRLSLDWDRCIIWSGMDAKTTDGTPLGHISDAEYSEKNGQVTRFFAADGGMAKALIGSFVIDATMVRGYSNGLMVVDTGGSRVALDGGLAGAAGEGYARAKAGASKVGKKVGAAAGEAVDKGSLALGRAIGKAKRAVAEAGDDAVPAKDVRVEKPAGRIAEKGAPAAGGPKKAPARTYAPAAKKPAAASKKPAPAAKKPATTGDKVARAAGKQLGAFGKMFGDFKDEFNKASK